MKIVFLGATQYSKSMLLHLLEHKFDVRAVFMIPASFDLKRKNQDASKSYENSNYADLGEVAEAYGIPCYSVDSKDGRNLTGYSEIIRNLQPDIILALGWFYMVPKTIREMAKLGAFGIHASLLPKYAGGAPLVWAMINGESTTGITFFQFDDGVDDGDIYAQKEISIDITDTIATLYQKVTQASRAIIVDELHRLENNTSRPIKQDKTKIKPFPLRTPDDGLINWKMKDMDLYNFVRAQTKPYPCAFSYLNKKRIKIISVELPSKVHFSYEQYAIGEIIRIDSKFYIKVSNNALSVKLIEVDGVEMEFSHFCRINNCYGQIFENR